MKRIITSIFASIIALTLTAQSTKQVLHRVTNESNFGSSKTEYIYDEFGNENKREQSSWDNSLLLWKPWNKLERSYDALGQLTEYKDAYWDDITLRWMPRYRYEYFCRFGDYLPDSKRYHWDEDKDEWEYYRHWYRTYNDYSKISESFYIYQNEEQISFKEEYIYDENNNLIQRIRYNQYDQEWELDYKYEYQYNADNQLIEEQSFNINSSQIWEVSRKTEYTYAPNGKEASRTMYDMEDNQWTYSGRRLYEYNASGEITLEARQAWQEDLQVWANSQTEEYTYDAAGNQLTRILSRWDYQTLLFQQSWKYEREFDQNNNPVQFIFSTANIPGQFFLLNRETYTYNYDYGHEDLVTPNGSSYNNMLLNEYVEEWDENLNEWQFETQTTYEYSLAEIRTPPILDVNYVCANVHPNPATDYITFRIVGASTPVRVRLFDVNGKLLNEEPLSEGSTISVSHLQRGVYFYQLFYNGIQRGGKFMVK